MISVVRAHRSLPALLAVGILALSGCSGSGATQTAGDEAETAAKQACHLWTEGQSRNIDGVETYFAAAAESAQVAAAADPTAWSELAVDLEAIYPLAVDPEAENVLDLLELSERIDAICSDYRSWPGDIVDLPVSESASALPSPLVDGVESDSARQLSLTPLSPEDLLLAVPSVEDLTEVAGRDWRPDKSNSRAAELFEGEVRGGIDEVSPPGCDAVTVYSTLTDPETGQPWLVNSWGERLEQTAEVFSHNVPKDFLNWEDPDKSASLVTWTSNLRLSTPDALTSTLEAADALLDSECSSATIDSERYLDKVYQDCEACGDLDREPTVEVLPAVMSKVRNTRVACYDSEYVTMVSIYEPVGAVLSYQGFQIDGSVALDEPSLSRIEPRAVLSGAITLYNRLTDSLAQPQGFPRSPVTLDEIVAACEQAQVETEAATEDRENAKYSAADVVYEVVTSDGGDVTMATPTGTSQQYVSSETTFPYSGFTMGDFLYVSVQNDSDRGSVECSIYVDGVEVSSNYSNSSYGIASCQASR